ncbi:hypothetical protein ACTVY4_19285, partial [Pseudomonas aeruginosa]
MQASKALLAALALGITGLAQAADEVVVYSSRIDELIKPVFAPSALIRAISGAS